jgi:polynucleotide 5'-hydroxyl-kinase GRC3/NOL9
MNDTSIEVSPEWQALKLDHLSGVLMVVGAPDSGKSTFGRYLFACLRELGQRVAFIDGDPGQSALGPPTTMTLTFDLDVLDERTSSHFQVWRYFIGSTTPQGHMLPVVVGAARLTQVAQLKGAKVVIYDTSGLIEPRHGGLALKNSKLDLLRPQVVYAIQREDELEPFLVPLRRSRRAEVIVFRPSKVAVHRDIYARREYRARQFAGYFTQAQVLDLEWSRTAVFPYPDFRMHRLVALEDIQGFTLGLGIVLSIDRLARRVRLLTPMHSLAEVNSVHLGDVLVNPDNYEDQQIMR